jgi:hypothetical protein
LTLRMLSSFLLSRTTCDILSPNGGTCQAQADAERGRAWQRTSRRAGPRTQGSIDNPGAVRSESADEI